MNQHYKLVKREYNEYEIEVIINDINNNFLYESGLSISRVKLQSKDDDLIYKLDKSEIKCDKSEIGSIVMNMHQYIEKKYHTIELHQLGFSLEEYYSVQEKVKIDESELLLEDILLRNKNMKAIDKVEKIFKHINKTEYPIRELIITDPYIFAAKNSYQCNEQIVMISKILIRLEPKITIFITDEKKSNKKVEDRIKFLNKGKAVIRYSDEWHDRFWIKNRSEGFVMGTSLNGIGSKISSINELDNADINMLVDYMEEEKLILPKLYVK
ncbi:hypothetical protein BACERE00185_04525 [Bacillus mobilis]|uniref:Uncharacterized protein n=1 Tax=Bacillus mobilis TaxID=2026190 RepID=A0A1Y6AGG4_9BACI|nr:hypothetical protein [Bacillus mobilis]SME38882.1 hypothetical protein BACERE00185_04525 [Bacillus mobilis]